jgi:hypothetical protein
MKNKQLILGFQKNKLIGVNPKKKLKRMREDVLGVKGIE